MILHPTILAAEKFDSHVVIIWGAVLIALVIIGFGAIMFVRRKLKNESSTSDDGGFSLSDLRDLRDRGEITPEEYERTRAMVIAKVKTMMKKEEDEDARGDTARGAP